MNDSNNGGGRVRHKSGSDKRNIHCSSPDIKIKSASESREAGGVCDYCGASYSSTAQICPECGMSVGRNRCTFCGNEMAPGFTECPSCGASADGVECPNCGTINFRNFCRSCNSPITPRGSQAIARFKADPKFKEAEKINDKLSVLADFIDGKVDASSPDVAALVEELGASVFVTQPEEKKTSQTGKRLLMPSFGKRTKPENETKPSDGVTPAKAVPMTIEEAMRLYEEKKAEMDALLDSIVPDSASTPEEQRDFHSARMVVVTRKYKRLVEQPVAWICNFCGFRHNNPQECAEPWHGGTWVHETKEVTYEESKLEKMK